jgi:hypothetical protein
MSEIGVLQDVMTEKSDEVIYSASDSNGLEASTNLEAVDLDALYQRLSLMESEIDSMNIKVQANVDFSDDIVGTTNNLLESVQIQLSQVIETTENTLAHADSLVGVYLWVLGGILVLGTLAINVYYSKRSKDHMDDAIERVVNKIATDGDVKDQLVYGIANDEEFKKAVMAKVEDLVYTAQEETKDPGTSGEFDET